MTREEFMEEAQKEIDQILITYKNRFMNLVMKAWAEGKKNAEYERVEVLGSEIGEFIKKKIEESLPPRINIDYSPIAKLTTTECCDNDIPASCRNCPNHPINGGSGICHCINGTQPIMCNIIATDICDAIEKDKISDQVFTVATAISNARDFEVYNACCDNHIKIIHNMMTGVKKDGENN